VNDDRVAADAEIRPVHLLLLPVPRRSHRGSDGAGSPENVHVAEVLDTGITGDVVGDGFDFSPPSKLTSATSWDSDYTKDPIPRNAARSHKRTAAEDRFSKRSETAKIWRKSVNDVADPEPARRTWTSTSQTDVVLGALTGKGQ